MAARLVFGALGSDTGRLGPPARRGQWPRRHQADPDPSEPPRDDGSLFLARQRGARSLAPCATRPASSGSSPDTIRSDATSSTMPVPDYEAAALSPDVRGLRVGVPRNYYHDTVDAGGEGPARRLAPGARGPRGGDRRGYRAPPRAHRAPPAHRPDLGGGDPARGLARGARRRLRPPGPGPDPPRPRNPGRRGTCGPSSSGRASSSDFVEQVFGKCDVLHLPAFPIPIPTIEETDVGASRAFTRVIAEHRAVHAPDQLPHLPVHRRPGRLHGERPPLLLPARRAGPSTKRPCSGPPPPTSTATGFPARAPEL